MLQQCLNWLSKQVDRVLSARKEALLKCSKGSVNGEPFVIWLHMINCPFIKKHPFKTYNAVVEKRGIFNRTLNGEIEKSRFATILTPANLTCQSGMFDNLGNLTFLGKQEFWKSVDSLIQDLDKSYPNQSRTLSVRDNTTN